MPSTVTFRPQDGAVLIDGCPLAIVAGVSRDEVWQALLAHCRGRQDHQNGYEWLRCSDFGLGGAPCSMGFCFLHGRLREVHWGVSLPDEELENGWPTRSSIDREIAFVRSVLSVVFERSFTTGEETFSWGTVWASFDAKGFQASSGVRYRGL